MAIIEIVAVVVVVLRGIPILIALGERRGRGITSRGSSARGKRVSTPFNNSNNNSNTQSREDVRLYRPR